MNQGITIHFGDIIITTAYVSPKATAEVELELLQPVDSHSNWKAIIFGDINVTYSDWNTENSARRRRLKNGQK